MVGTIRVNMVSGYKFVMFFIRGLAGFMMMIMTCMYTTGCRFLKLVVKHKALPQRCVALLDLIIISRVDVCIIKVIPSCHIVI